jgi:membrane fusion protein (multidrug efflux system)
VGHAEAIQTVDLRARVQGFLEQVNFKEGNFVNVGDILYVIEQAPYKARVDASKARVDQAQAALTYASRYLQRLRGAGAASVPATDIDNAEAAELQAKAQLDEAQANLRLSELDLGYTTIKAPISGRIGRTAYTKGNLVGPTSVPLARIVQPDPIRVVYSISENDLTTIQVALKDSSQEGKNPILVPRIKLSNGEIYKVAGYVDFVNNEVDSSTGTIAVWAVFDNRDGMLLPGQYVTVLLKQSKPEILPVVLQSAVQEDRQGRYVLIVNAEDRVVERRVKTGPFVGIWWAIESGLTEGEKVIVQGVQKVRPGQLVKTITENEQKER